MKVTFASAAVPGYGLSPGTPVRAACTRSKASKSRPEATMINGGGTLPV